MIRTLIIDGITSVLSRHRMEQVKDIFRSSFPSLAYLADEIPLKLKNPIREGYLSKLLILEKKQNLVLGFAFIIHFPSIYASFLDFFAVHSKQRGLGIGGSLYESVQEHCRQMGSQALYIDVSPDDPTLTKNERECIQNQKRIRFYERYGCRVVINKEYSKPVGNPPTYAYLMIDPLNNEDFPDITNIKSALSRIFLLRFSRSVTPEYITNVLESITEEGFRLRPIIKKRKRKLINIKVGKFQEKFALIYNLQHKIHHLHDKGYLESPIRVQAIMDALEGSPLFNIVRVKKIPDTIISELHSPDLIQYLKIVCSQLNENNIFYPDTFPIRRSSQKPKNLAIQAGYYCLDDGTPLYKGAFIAAKAALNTALTGADEILSGKKVVYAVCRPPGHHAGINFFGGFCYFNNAAAAAHFLSEHHKVAILDLDFHHGNGTQDIFYHRSDILTLSIHGDPNYSYPYFSGFIDEIGEGEGKGFNQNYPLPPDTNDSTYLKTLEIALTRIKEFRTEILIVSLGYDILKGDPTGNFNISFRGMSHIALKLRELNIPILLIQEGGYHMNNIRRGCEAFFLGLIN
ncbi:MAG: histone deacetylase family protein [Candidatus Lokiarchaeota archaeon]|nr:histone deacetylase family protein [Candidatus Lokiarchaeota archaeon]